MGQAPGERDGNRSDWVKLYQETPLADGEHSLKRMEKYINRVRRIDTGRQGDFASFRSTASEHQDHAPLQICHGGLPGAAHLDHFFASGPGSCRQPAGASAARRRHSL